MSEINRRGLLAGAAAAAALGALPSRQRARKRPTPSGSAC
jgi:hypothetical protein